MNISKPRDRDKEMNLITMMLILNVKTTKWTEIVNKFCVVNEEYIQL